MGKRKTRQNANSVVLRVFKCPTCELVLKAPKGRDTGAQHLKDMWCPNCMGIEKFQQIDSDRIYT